MREVFTTSGYALVDDGLKLSTPNGLSSLEHVSRELLAGEKVLVESLQGEFGVREHMDADVLPSPGAIMIDKGIVARLIIQAEATFASRKEVSIPRICFSCILPMLSRLRKKSRKLLRCEVDNKSYPCEILVRAEGQGETELLAVTDIFEDGTTIMEIPSSCKAMVIDGLICS